MKHKILFSLGVLLSLTLVMGSYLYAQNSDRDLFLDAEARFLSGNYPLALEQYDELIRKWPDSPYLGDTRYRRAIILYKLGKHQDAYRAFETIERRYRSTKYLAYIPFWKALIEYDAKEYSKAFQKLSSLSLNSLDEKTWQQALLYKGRAALALDDTEQALEAFESLYKNPTQKPLDPETEGSLLVYLSDLYSKLGKFEDQNRLWEALPKDSLGAEIREPLALRSAEAYLALQKSDKAIPLLETLSTSTNPVIAGKALQYLLSYEQKRGNDEGVASVIIKAENLLRGDPDALAAFWTQVGAATFYEGKLDLARAYLLRVLAIVKSDAMSQDVPIYLAEISWRQGDKQLAIKTLTDAEAQLKTEKALLLSRLQWYALQEGEWDEAIRFGQKAVTQAEKEGREDLSLQVRSYLAYSLYRKNEYAQALDVLGTDLVPPGPKELAKRLQSRLLQRTGESVAALESYNTLIQQNPANPELYIERMNLLFEKAQYGQVLASAQELESKFDLAKLSSPYRFGFLYMKGLSSAMMAGSADAYGSAADILAKALDLAPRGDRALPWALYYKGWALYRSGRFTDAAVTFEQFAAQFPDHDQTYGAAYLGAWSYARQGQYQKAALLAQKAGDRVSAANPEAMARARYLEGVLRSFYSDWTGALKALDQAAAVQTPYAVRASFEKGNVYYRMGRIQDADAAFAAVQRNYSQDPLAEAAAYRRGELFYSTKQWKEALDRFTQYRQSYQRGSKVDGALYFSGSIQQELSQIDSAILLWERLLREYPSSTYRLPAMIALEKAYWSKQDWENALRVGTNAMVEFGEAAKSAGLEDDVATLRYLISGMSERAARLQVQLVKQQGVTSAEGRKTALELARYYIIETSQREAGLALTDQVLAYRGEDGGAAAEALYLKGEYYGLLEAWDKSAAAYLDSIDLAGTLKAGQARQDLIPEALFKAARSTLRLGKTESARQLVATLQKQYGSSPWAKQAERLLEAAR
jgi:tetratricopeptide (TPR) repeat protein